MEVLLVEDNPADQMLAKVAFDEVDFPCHLSIVENGLQAMEFLTNAGEFADAKRPDLVLLDLNMPKMNGHEVLEAVKSNPDLAQIPVVVLTTSSNQGDVESCYAAHANSYIRKPADMNDFSAAIKELEHYWFELSSLPKEN